MTLLPRIFGRGGADANSGRRAIERPLRARQAASSSSEASSTTASTAVSTSDSSATSAGSSATDSSLTSSASITSGTSASTVLPSNAIASTEPNGQVVLSLITPPPWTATSLTAYTAPGVNTTTKPPPPITSSSSSSSSSSSTSSTSISSTYSAPGSWATAFGIPKNELTACKIDGKNYTDGPFCSPIHQQDMWIGYTYAITWNVDLFPINATNSVQLMYNDTALGNATVTDGVPSYQGYQDITVDEAWLQGADGNSSRSGQNVTLMMIADVPGGVPAIIKSGPTVALVRNPKTLPPVLIPKISNKYGLEIGLPIGVVALIVIILSVCCAVKKNNGRFRNLKGSMTQDHMSRRARRGGGGRRGGGKGGEYDEMELGPTVGQSGYTDEPVKGGENAFRDEIRRQRDEDDTSVKRTYSSY